MKSLQEVENTRLVRAMRDNNKVTGNKNVNTESQTDLHIDVRMCQSVCVESSLSSTSSTPEPSFRRT